MAAKSLFRVISILAKIWKNTFPKEFVNEIWLQCCEGGTILKGALDNFSLIPNFFFKKVQIFVSLEVYTYVVTAC